MKGFQPDQEGILKINSDLRPFGQILWSGSEGCLFSTTSHFYLFILNRIKYISLWININTKYNSDKRRRENVKYLIASIFNGAKEKTQDSYFGEKFAENQTFITITKIFFTLYK